MPTTAYLSSEGGYADDMESIENQMIIARREKKLVKTIKDVLKALSNCKYYGTCDKCPYSDDELPTCVLEMKNDAIHAINGLLEENQSLHEALDIYGGDEGITAVYEERDRLADENRALRTELTVNSGDYWRNICKMNAKQEAKGLEKYGEPLEENTTLTTVQRIEHAQEEAIDLLKYLEHLKQVVDSDGITANDYQRACLRTATSDKSEWLENAIYGIIGEAGEIVDLVKKHKWQGHELDREALILECGDLAWYQSLLMSAIDCTLGEAYKKNIEKLKQRYPEGFSKDRSINRKE